MDLSQAPAFVAAKMAMLSDACAAAATGADELTGQIAHMRDRLNGRVVREGDHPAELRFEFDRLLAEQKAIHARRPIETDTIDRCKAWLAALPPRTVLDQVAPVVEDGLSLTAVRARIKKLQESVAVLKRVPIPAPDIRQKVQSYVRGLTRPIIGGVDAGEVLAVQWPTEQLHVLMAFLQPEVLVERLMAEINRIANTPCALPEREQQIAELECEIERLQRTDEAILGLGIGTLASGRRPPLRSPHIEAGREVFRLSCSFAASRSMSVGPSYCWDHPSPRSSRRHPAPIKSGSQTAVMPSGAREQEAWALAS
jgi:hypothetical protein